MRRLALPLAVLAVALALPAFADDADGSTKLSPLQIGQIFCISIAGNDMAPVEAILTAGLRKAIARAETLDAAWAKKNPGEKPPLGDGLPWQAHPDYTADCTAAPLAATDKEAHVGITYKFADEPSADYTDTLVLKPVADRASGSNIWRLDDIDFADNTGMRQDLIDAFRP